MEHCPAEPKDRIGPDNRKEEHIVTEPYRDPYVSRCPYCGGTRMIEAFQSAYGAVTATSNKLGGRPLYHSVCLNCGSVVRSYVKEPQKLLKRKDRDPG